jgi:hypothetical protein
MESYMFADCKIRPQSEQLVQGSIKEAREVATIFELILEPTGRAEDETSIGIAEIPQGNGMAEG